MRRTPSIGASTRLRCSASLTCGRRGSARVVEGGRDAVYVGNLGGGIRTVEEVRVWTDAAAWFNADHQGRSGDTPIWDCAQQGRVAQAVMHGRAITNVTGAYSNSQPTWRHVAKPAAEATMWLAQTTASGMVPWFRWLGGAPEDTRWKAVGRDFFSWLARHEPHFRNTRSIARRGGALSAADDRVLSLRLARSRADQRLPARVGLRAARRTRALRLRRTRTISCGGALQKYRALLVPNAAYLDDEPCAAIRKFVAAGGSPAGDVRDVALHRLGRQPAGSSRSRTSSARASTAPSSVRAATATCGSTRGHPVTQGFEDTALLPGPESRVPIRATAPGRPALTVVPDYPAFPPEMVFPRTPRTDAPAAIFREAGPARVAYFAGDIDRTLWRSGSVDLSRLVQNTVRWLLGA